MPTSSPHAQQGATLIESMVAILIFSTGLLALMGLQATSISYSTDSKYRAEASYFADQIVGRMWAGGGNASLAAYACNPCSTGGNAETLAWMTQIQAGGGLPNATASIAIIGNTATVSVGWRAPHEPLTASHAYVTVADITKNF